jgi:predicted dehydrogenase
MAKDPVDLGGVRDDGENPHAVCTARTDEGVDVIGSGGEMTIHLPFNAYPDVPLQVSDQYVEMFEAFSRTVREGGSVPTPPQDAIANMKVLDALFRSEKSGTWEKVR